MDTQTTQSPWTDEDWKVASAALRTATGLGVAGGVVVVLDALAPRVAELQRAAKVEALNDVLDILVDAPNLDLAYESVAALHLRATE